MTSDDEFAVRKMPGEVDETAHPQARRLATRFVIGSHGGVTAIAR
jgi:hypothetical protein